MLCDIRKAFNSLDWGVLDKAMRAIGLIEYADLIQSMYQGFAYRIITKYEELGIVKKGDFHNEASRYTLENSSTHSKNHEHYFKCTKCYTVESFSDCLVSKKEKELESNGYRSLSHHLEISGLCPSCAI